MRAMARLIMAAGVLALCGTTASAQPGMFGGTPTANLRTALFSNAALQDELKVTADQATKLKELGAKQAEELKPYIPPPPIGFGGGFGGFGGGRGGFNLGAQAPRDDESALVFHKLQVKQIEERMAAIKGTLSAEQQKRLAQLETQQLSVTAFANARVAKALDLTADATKKLQQMTDEMNKTSQEMTQEAFQGGFDREVMQELQKKQRTLREETVEKMVKTLTAAQQKTWKELTGEPFDFTKLAPRPPM